MLATILSGVFVYVFGQVIIKLWIDPVQEFKRLIGDVAHALIEYANIHANPGTGEQDRERMVSREYRKLSSRLSAQIHLVPCYDTTAKIFRLPPRMQVIEAERHLIGLSNSLYKSSQNNGTRNSRKAVIICDLLGIYVAEGDRIPPLPGEPEA